MNTFKILLKREFWENRGGFLWAPIVLSAVFLTVVALTLLAVRMKVGDHIEIDGQMLKLGQIGGGIVKNGGQAAREGLAIVALMGQFPLAIVTFFYLLGSLFDDRKDRSILFWKSMPVSDLSTLASKFVSAVLVAPIITFGVIVVTQILLLCIVSVLLASLGVSEWRVLWAESDLFGLWTRLLVGIPFNILWTLPAVGWLMMVSSWTRSLPFLWAVFTPLGIGLTLSLIELLTSLQIPEGWFYLNVFARAIFGVLPWSFGDEGSSLGFHLSTQHPPTAVFSWSAMADVAQSMPFWIGIVAGVVMLAVAFYFRRYKEIAD